MLRKNSSELHMSLAISFFCCFLLVNGDSLEKKYTESEAKEYLKRINAEIQVKTTESMLASWAYESNITDETLRNQLEFSAKLANCTKEVWKETIKYPWKTFKDPDVRRQFEKLSVLGTAILSPSKYEKLNKIVNEMQSVYGKARICSYRNRSDCNLQLEPELTEILAKSRDPDELSYYWQQWRNVAGKPVRKMYKEYVDLSNEAAVLNNYTDTSQLWLKDYEAQDFKSQVEELWQRVRPLYLQLHAYVRRRLREKYGEEHVPKRGPIPAHLLGNMWAQAWSNTFDFTAPYPNKPSIDVTPNMVAQGYNPLRMFKLAEEFFTSLNLSPMPDTFWKNSILEKPTDGRELICHASAWDFYDGKDFRIKECTRITVEDLNVIHHEMGHIQYFLQYKNQPLVYKDGANPGFHEAVGDVIALSVSTPNHLSKIGLLNATDNDPEIDMNQLFNTALDKIALLPFGYLMEQWRWNVFEGKITESNYNCKWWQFREKYQGLSPPVERSEEDFDPGAKYHTVGNVPFIRYFVSFVIQFQFHRSLCIAAQQYDPNNPAAKPLHKCDIYQSKEAGALLQKMLQMGSSKPWPDAMEVLTGQRKMDARPLLEYFDSLQKWLEEENKRTNEFIGWESKLEECTSEGKEEGGVDGVKKQGNYEDENIAYSYAEFVHQDDNSFGFPDYSEETQFPYLSLRHGAKEKLQADYFSPKKKAGLISRHDPYVPHNVVNKNEFMDPLHLQKLAELNAKLSNRQLLSHAPNHRANKAPVSAINKNQETAANTEKSKFINEFLRSLGYAGNKETASNRLTGRKCISGVNLTSNEGDAAACGNSRRPAFPRKEGPCECKCNKSPKEKCRTQAPKHECSNREENANTCTSEQVGCDDEILRLVSEICSQKIEPCQLSRKIDLIKQRIEKLIKSAKPADPTKCREKATGFYSVSSKPHHKIMIICLGAQSNSVKDPPKACKTDRCAQPQYLNRENLSENILRPGYNSVENNPEGQNVKQNNVLRIISAELANDDGENETKHKNGNPAGLHSAYVMFSGKPPKSKKKKKSYTEYHFKRKYPALYNEIIITNNAAKTDKPEDLKTKKDSGVSDPSDKMERLQYTVPRQEESYGGYPHKSFQHSVRYDDLNKNNIVQYFGCLQLLL